MNRREGKKIAVMTAVIMGFMVIAFMPLASAGVTSFTVTPNTGIAGDVQSYSAYVITDGVTSIYITIPAGFSAVAPTIGGEEIARLEFYNSSTKAYYGYAIITANNANPATKVDIYWELGGDTMITTQEVKYAPGEINTFESPLGDGSFAILELPETLGGKDGSIEITINSTAFLLDAVMTSIKQFVRNPLTPGDYDFFADGKKATVSITGDGYYGAGVYRFGHWFLRTEDPPIAKVDFWWGRPYDKPVTGDWNDNGKDTIGLYRFGFWILSNSITTPSWNYFVWWGLPTDKPVTGDWDGVGGDTIGLYRFGEWILSDSITTPSRDYNVWWGRTTDIPVTGDWNGDGTDTIGLYRNGEWILSNSIKNPARDHTVWWGRATDIPVTGDWDGDGYDTIGTNQLLGIGSKKISVKMCHNIVVHHFIFFKHFICILKIGGG
jgi:hypothetical protein